MASYPTDLRYTPEHMWVRARDNVVTAGVTEFVADQLGEIGFVELPYAGELFKSGVSIGRITSDSSSSALRMPVLGKVTEINRALTAKPGLVSSDPYGDGWMFRIEPGDMGDVDGLLEAADYEASLAASDD